MEVASFNLRNFETFIFGRATSMEQLLDIGYIRFLATPESIDLLRRFAAHRFRDIEVEKRRNKILAEVE